LGLWLFADRGDGTLACQSFLKQKTSVYTLHGSVRYMRYASLRRSQKMCSTSCVRRHDRKFRQPAHSGSSVDIVLGNDELKRHCSQELREAAAGLGSIDGIFSVFSTVPKLQGHGHT